MKRQNQANTQQDQKVMEVLSIYGVSDENELARNLLAQWNFATCRCGYTFDLLLVKTDRNSVICPNCNCRL
jgi:hypothetical protein